MYMTFRMSTAILATVALMTIDSAEVLAQCGGGRNTGSAASSGRPAGLSSGSPALAFALASQGYSLRYPSSSALSMQPQPSPAVQQMLANRQQMIRQQAEQRYQRKQELLAMRRDRAQAVRLARAERTLARLQSKGESGQPGGSDDSESLYAAKSPSKRSSF